MNKILALVNALAVMAMPVGQSRPPQNEVPRVIMVTHDRIFDPIKQLLKPVTPIPVESREDIVKAAIRGELVVKSDGVVAIYTPSALREFPNYPFILAAQEFLKSRRIVIGQTDKDEWARLTAIDLVSRETSSSASVALAKLETNGFAENPGEVYLEPSYKLQVEVGGKRIVALCTAGTDVSKLSSFLGNGYAWSFATQATSREEHLYSTFNLGVAKTYRKKFDEKITEALKSSFVFSECARAVKETLEVPYNLPIEITSLPSSLREDLLFRLPALMRANNLDPNTYQIGNLRKVKVVGVGLCAKMAITLNNVQSFVTINRALPNP